MRNVLYKVENGIAIISLNRPEALNALNDTLKKDIIETVSIAIDDSSVRSIILTGEGRAFCAGGDVKSQANRENDIASRRDDLTKLSNLILDLYRSPKPVITAINGYAIGAGLGLALAGDLIISSANAKFSTPFLKLGLVADAGVSYLASRRIGTEKTKRLLFTGEEIEVETAKDWGLIDWIVPPDQLLPYAIELATQLATSSKTAVEMTKLMMNSINELTIDSALKQEINNQVICFMTDEHKNRVNAFLKR